MVVVGVLKVPGMDCPLVLFSATLFHLRQPGTAQRAIRKHREPEGIHGAFRRGKKPDLSIAATYGLPL